MLQTLRGIVLRTIRYKDSQMIVDLYTKERGRISCSVTISQSRKTASRKVLFQPLSILEVQVELHSNVAIYKLRDAKLYDAYKSIPFDPIKNALALFLAEFLSYALREEAENVSLYSFLENSFCWLDESTVSVANFHIAFLLRLSRFVGLYPYLENYEQGACFDLLAATFVTKAPVVHSYYIKEDEARFVIHLMRMRYETMRCFRMNRSQRQRCLEIVNLFYSLHLPDFPARLHSLDILKELFC